MINLKNTGFITHAASWLIFFSLPALFMTNQNEASRFGHFLSITSYWIFVLTFVSLFYLTSYLLIPRFYLKQKYTLFFSIIFLLFAGVYFLKPFERLILDKRREANTFKGMAPAPMRIENHDFKDHLPRDRFRNGQGKPKGPIFFDIVSVFLFIMVIALSMAIQINRQLYLIQKKAIKAEADKAEAELSFLKAQINPHFLFNTLNNIYSLAVTSSPDTAESIMKLSNIMRYVTDEIGQDMVLLQDELDCISDFIGLQQLRLGENTPVDYNISGAILNHVIPPMVLMTFVENVFKYGISKQKESPVTIKITATENSIHFYSQNNIFIHTTQLNRAGIGIENTKQRLQHIYPGKHTLEIKSEDELFTVNLSIYK